MAKKEKVFPLGICMGVFMAIGIVVTTFYVIITSFQTGDTKFAFGRISAWLLIAAYGFRTAIVLGDNPSLEITYHSE
jgi:ABC-type transport system involved in cytochrome c biogenesis permease subunit